MSVEHMAICLKVCRCYRIEGLPKNCVSLHARTSRLLKVESVCCDEFQVDRYEAMVEWPGPGAIGIACHQPERQWSRCSAKAGVAVSTACVMPAYDGLGWIPFWPE